MGLSQIAQNVQNQRELRCSSRRRRPPSAMDFPAYLDPNFSTRPYEHTDSSGKIEGFMSDTVSVKLFPKAFDQPGNEPGDLELEPIAKFLQENYPEYKFIKGHMWNQEIGGLGVTQNLVPLTSKANSAHKSSAEQPIKDTLRDFVSFYARNTANHEDFDKVYGFNYVVEIEKAFWKKVSGNLVPNSIHVQITPIKYDNVSKNTSEDRSIIDKITFTDSKRKLIIEDLIKGIWIDQEGNVTQKVVLPDGTLIDPS